MLVYKLTKTLTNPLDPEWDLLAHSELGDGVHSDRKMGFLLSREALKNALFEFGLSCQPKDLKLNHYDELMGLPQFTISLSHTKDWGAALVAERKDLRSIGIDIEHEERIVKDSVRERIGNKSDENLRNIELWCLKEAVFKALLNTRQFDKPVEFSSIVISKNTWFHLPSGFGGSWELETINSMVVAQAYLKN
jgi:4'-phosphopantetheinyl transferase EntD